MNENPHNPYTQSRDDFLKEISKSAETFSKFMVLKKKQKTIRVILKVFLKRWFGTENSICKKGKILIYNKSTTMTF